MKVNGAVHGRRTRVISCATDLSCFLRDASVSMQADTAEATGFCHGLKQYVDGFVDGSMSLSGFYDSGWEGSDRTLFSQFGRSGTRMPMVVEPEGHCPGKSFRAFQGIMTSYDTSFTVSDIESISMQMQLTGELYVGGILSNFETDGLTATSGVADGIPTGWGQIYDRLTVFEASSPYNAGATIEGSVYVQFRNPSASAVRLVVRHYPSATSGSPGAGVVLYNEDVAAGECVSLNLEDPITNNGGLVGERIQINLDMAATPGAAPADVTEYPFFMGIVDKSLSMLNTGAECGTYSS